MLSGGCNDDQCHKCTSTDTCCTRDIIYCMEHEEKPYHSTENPQQWLGEAFAQPGCPDFWQIGHVLAGLECSTLACRHQHTPAELTGGKIKVFGARAQIAYFS